MVIVFGAGGFIGTYLTDHLAGLGRPILAADVSGLGEAWCLEQGIPFRRVDITRREDFDALPRNGVDAVVHLAALQPANVSAARYDPVDFVRTNVIGTLHILDYCRRTGVERIIYTCSHRNTQGLWKSRAGTPIREDDGRSLLFAGDYAMFSISESAAADCVEHYAEAHGLRGIVLRIPPVYGYGPHMEIFKDGRPLRTGFQVFIDRALAGQPLEVWGDADAGRDILYVKDAVAAVVRALDTPEARGLYNIASGHRLTLREQAETIARVFGPPAAPPAVTFRPEKPNSIETYVYDISRAQRELGWTPRYSFEDMLRDYRVEEARGRYSYLLEKRRRMLDDRPQE